MCNSEEPITTGWLEFNFIAARMVFMLAASVAVARWDKPYGIHFGLLAILAFLWDWRACSDIDSIEHDLKLNAKLDLLKLKADQLLLRAMEESERKAVSK